MAARTQDGYNEILNRSYVIGTVAGVAGAVLIAASIYEYWEFRAPDTPFWTTLQNDTREVVIGRGETKTIPLELHYWKGLRTLLGIEFEAPEAPAGGPE
ncbi:MAG: hypothetical protein ACREBU_06945 [Nitrososphaera sp.]